MLEGKNNWKAWLYLLPSLILLGIFSFYPIIKTFIIAFIRDYYPVKSVFSQYVEANREAGLGYFTFQNLATIFKDPDFSKSILNTCLIAFVSVPISVLLSLVISVLLISIKKLRGFFQTLFFLPYVTSAMAVSMAFTVLFVNAGDISKGFTSGPVNTVLEITGLEKSTMNSLDWIYWVSEGKTTYYQNVYCDKKGNLVIEDAEKSYNAYQANYNFNKLLDPTLKGYDNFDDWYDNEVLAKNEVLKYKYRHHYKTLGWEESKGSIYEYTDGYIDWVGSGATWATCIIVVLLYSTWSGMAFKILVFTGGLTSIDKQYYDAAKIDATSKWRTFWKITVPMMSPLIVYLLTTSLIGSFKTYTSIVGLFGEDMADGKMMTFVGIVYKFLSNDSIRFSAAAAVILFAFIFLVTQLTNRFTKKRVHY